jgi:small-conductance mechanosensitive channel
MENRAIILASLFCLLLLLPVSAVAQEGDDADPELPGIQHIVAPVKIDGKALFNVRGVSSFTAEQRAAVISKRIKDAAADNTVSPDSVKTVVVESYLSVYAGTKFIMNIYDADAEVEEISIEVLARIVKDKTAMAIKLYRDARKHSSLIKKSFTALGALIAMTLFMFIILWLGRRIHAGLQKRISAKVDMLEGRSFNLIRANQLWKTFDLSFRIIKIIIIVLITAGTANYILGLFPWTSNVASSILNMVLDPFRSLGKGLLNFLPDLAFLIVIYIVTRYLLKLGKLFFTGLSQGSITLKKFEPEWAMPTFRLIRILIIAFAVIIAYPFIPGSDSVAFKGVSVFIGILFSLGSSSFISNLVAGYSMTYRGAFKAGDRIQVGDQVGFVEAQEVLVTRLRTIKNEEVIIPNSVMLNSNITNFSTKAKGMGLILHTTVGIGYETPWRHVEAMLKEAADRTEGLLKQPPPFVLQLSLGDFAINYELNVFCNDASKMILCYSALHQNILDVFNENNVQIMTPAYEGDPEIPKVVPKDLWNPPLTDKK